MKLRIVASPRMPKIVLVTQRGCRKIVEYAPPPVPTRRKFMHFDTTAELVVFNGKDSDSLHGSSPDVKKMQVVKNEAGIVTDYRDVGIRGYLSTFKGMTESDRDGEYVEPGAFRETLKNFAKNPVMLVDHRNQVANVAGSFSKFVEDKNGLYVEGMLSNSPDNVDVRFKVAEGHVKTLSMGGIWHYNEDGRGIFKVNLWEGSIVAVPANPDALFQVRECTEQEIKRIEFCLAAEAA